MSDFADKVYQATKTIPSGKVATYGWVAAAVGSPKAYRAVGSVLARNPTPIIVPCHRVVNSKRELTGFFGKKDSESLLRKRRLLESEDIKFDHTGKVRVEHLIS